MDEVVGEGESVAGSYGFDFMPDVGVPGEDGSLELAFSATVLDGVEVAVREMSCATGEL